MNWPVTTNACAASAHSLLSYGVNNLWRRPGQRVIAALVASAFTACATLPPPAVPSPDVRAELGRVAVLSGNAEMQVDSDALRHTGNAGAGDGTQVLVTCLGEGARGVCSSGLLCAPAMVLLLGICGVAGGVVAIADSVTSETAVALAGSKEAFQSALDANAVQQALRVAMSGAVRRIGAEVSEVAPALAETAMRTGDYRMLAGSGVDTLIEATLLRLSFSEGRSGHIAFGLSARARIIRTRDNKEQFSKVYTFVSEARTRADWTANSGAAVVTALRRAHQELAGGVVDHIFVLNPFPYQAARSIGFLTVSFGLAPEYPGTRGNLLTGDNLAGNMFEWTSVDSLQPTLRWESFPRRDDMEAAPEAMRRIADVSYDLVIARAVNYSVAEIAYRRLGIPANVHQLTEPLRPGGRYFWTVRARFRQDGQHYVTEWAALNSGARAAYAVPNRFSYRFVVPDEDRSNAAADTFR